MKKMSRVQGHLTEALALFWCGRTLYMACQLVNQIMILGGQLCMLIGIQSNRLGHVGSVKNMRIKGSLIQIAHSKT